MNKNHRRPEVLTAVGAVDFLFGGGWDGEGVGHWREKYYIREYCSRIMKRKKLEIQNSHAFIYSNLLTKN